MEMRKKFIADREFAKGQVLEATGGAEALMCLEQSVIRTLVIDPALEDLDVEELVRTIAARYPKVDIVILKEPVQSPGSLFDGLLLVSDESPDEKDAEAESNLFPLSPLHKRPLAASHPSDSKSVSLPGMIGSSHKMQELYRLARLVAPRDTTVLIVGETGTGKELVARGIHDLSRRSRGPFMVVNCAAIPESLLEAELFGFTRGAFTGAVQSRIGRIHAAHGGTLLLDEVGELPLGMQAKLLRFVQEGEVQRLGSSEAFRVDTRVIAATNVDLARRVREKQFREDLYYRLAVFPIELPPLRHRAEDVIALARHFLSVLSREAGSSPRSFSNGACNLMRKFSWPGNVRELQHRIERAFVLAEESPLIHAEHLTLPSEEANA
jgi:transcriptional regulator with GAF, ATPase, and Fis domain